MMQQAVTDGDGRVKSSEHPPDFPPESFCLSKGAEFEWLGRNAFYVRKESTKLTSNAFTRNSSNDNTPNTLNYSASPRTKRNPSSKTQAFIIGFLNPKSRFAEANAKDRKKKNCHNGSMRLFAGQTGSSPDVIEPPSPEVSCTGRVTRTKVEPGRSGLGLFAVFRGMVWVGSRRRNSLENGGHCKGTKERSSGGSRDAVASKSLGVGGPPELGGLKLFSSCRGPDVHG